MTKTDTDDSTHELITARERCSAAVAQGNTELLYDHTSAWRGKALLGLQSENPLCFSYHSSGSQSVISGCKQGAQGATTLRAQEPPDTSSWVRMDPQQRPIHSPWEREQSLPRQQPQRCWAINNPKKNASKPQTQPHLTAEFYALNYTPCYGINSENPYENQQELKTCSAQDTYSHFYPLFLSLHIILTGHS